MAFKSVWIALAVLLSVHSIDGFLHRFNPYPYYEPPRRQIFGDMTTSRIGFQHETRFGIPFLRREVLISFPSDYSTDIPYDRTFLIRGILHENELNDPDCLPELDIIDGGVYDRNVTLKITSLSGCGIDSKVSIFGEGNWKN